MILETKNLTIGYTHKNKVTRVVAESIDVGLEGGELVCLLGPNGAGKSTLMRTIAGMQRPLTGQVLLNGKDVTILDAKTIAKQLSVVLTERIDVGMLSTYALVALGRTPYTSWSGKLTEEDERIVQAAITAVSATDLAHRQVSHLSDGERQKVMIARALAQEPQLMILDEPTAYLDLPRRVEIMRILRNLARSQNRAILLSTHDLDLALRSADKIWFMPQEGMMQIGTPEDLVLNGTFEETFLREGVQFDAQSGSFKIHRQFAGDIDLIGDGLPAVWVKRALEREGFQVHRGPNGSQTQVEVLNGSNGNGNGRYHWQLSTPVKTTEHQQIATLIHALKDEQTE